MHLSHVPVLIVRERVRDEQCSLLSSVLGTLYCLGLILADEEANRQN
jgi:hypothetical protein